MSYIHRYAPALPFCRRGRLSTVVVIVVVRRPSRRCSGSAARLALCWLFGMPVAVVVFRLCSSIEYFGLGVLVQVLVQASVSVRVCSKKYRLGGSRYDRDVNVCMADTKHK